MKKTIHLVACVFAGFLLTAAPARAEDCYGPQCPYGTAAEGYNWALQYNIQRQEDCGGVQAFVAGCLQYLHEKEDKARAEQQFYQQKADDQRQFDDKTRADEQRFYEQKAEEQRQFEEKKSQDEQYGADQQRQQQEWARQQEEQQRAADEAAREQQLQQENGQ